MFATQMVDESSTELKRDDALLNILVVENHPDTREFLVLMLQGLGYEVVAADSMAAALTQSTKARFDVLISDIGLPDGDGWRLLARMKARPPFTIAMSGFGMSADRIRSKQAGYRHHLVKPMGLEQLEGILQEAVRELRGGGRPKKRAPAEADAAPDHR